MKALGLNPYLPSWEFVPDGEPHVFDGRVYLYGSHDSRNGVSFCEETMLCGARRSMILATGGVRESAIAKIRIRSMERPMRESFLWSICRQEHQRIRIYCMRRMSPRDRTADIICIIPLDFTNVISVAVSDEIPLSGNGKRYFSRCNDGAACRWYAYDY